MSDDIEKLTSTALKFSETSTAVMRTRAFNAVDAIVKIASRKKLRSAAIDALQIICGDAADHMRRLTSVRLGSLLRVDDTDRVPFLRAAIRDRVTNYCGVAGLLKILGAACYADIVGLVCDAQFRPGDRYEALELLCEHSGQRFMEDVPQYFDEVTVDSFPVTAIREWEAKQFPDYVEPVVSIPVNELASIGIKLPADYMAFLLKQIRPVEFEHNDSQWELTLAAGLLEEIEVDEENPPRACQLRAFTQTLRQASGCDMTEDAKGKPYPLDRLAAGIAIGSGDMGQILYIDPADNDSVWAFHPDGGDVERVAKSFAAWLRKAHKATGS